MVCPLSIIFCKNMDIGICWLGLVNTLKDSTGYLLSFIPGISWQVFAASFYLITFDKSKYFHLCRVSSPGVPPNRLSASCKLYPASALLISLVNAFAAFFVSQTT